MSSDDIGYSQEIAAAIRSFNSSGSSDALCANEEAISREELNALSGHPQQSRHVTGRNEDEHRILFDKTSSLPCLMIKSRRELHGHSTFIL